MRIDPIMSLKTLSKLAEMILIDLDPEIFNEVVIVSFSRKNKIDI
jgi:hypothetical protein